jgi:glycosyltransferase involved in cell wall biosynthesis
VAAIVKADVSVVIPAFNARRFIGEALDSVLAQTVLPRQVIVVDDGSVDGTAEVVRRYAPRVTLLQQDNAGNAAARNRGVAAADGARLAFLDADDTWCAADKLERQAAALDVDPTLDMVFGLMVQYEERMATLREPQRAPVAGAMLIRRASFDRVGPFREVLRLGVFIEWYARARDRGLVELVLPVVVLRRRVHDDNTSVRERSRRGVYASLLKESIDRRRRASGALPDAAGPSGSSPGP